MTFCKTMKLSRGVKWGCIVPVLGLFVLIGVALLFDKYVPSSAHRALPKSATNIQEYYSDSWNGDFVRVIKSKLPEKDYEDYAKALKMNTRFDATKHKEITSMINIGAGDAPSWWDPPKATGTTYFEYIQGDDYVQTLKYSNGTVYLLVISW